MRLTLRTLLAYLDDVLDPADKEELGKKIESSEFAQDLMHRTRDTMRRLRLSAPQVVGAGMGLDPNSVAEYLDNALPPDSMGDFERICLESDMHLAEVASCHHVLTMVLGQPADVDPAAKQRMYTIPTEAAERKRLRIESAHSHAAAAERVAMPIQGAAPVPIAAALAAAASVPSREIEIPEYLRASGWSKYRGLILGLAALLLVGTTVYLLGGLNRWFGGGTTETALVANNDDLGIPAANTVGENELGQDGPPAETAAVPAPQNVDGANVASVPAGPGTPPGEAPRYAESATAPAGEPLPLTGPLTPNANPSAATEPTPPELATADPTLPSGSSPYPVTSDPDAPQISDLTPPVGDAPVRLPATNETATGETPNPYAVAPTIDAPPYAATPDGPLMSSAAGAGSTTPATTTTPAERTVAVGAVEADETAMPDGGRLVDQTDAAAVETQGVGTEVVETGAIPELGAGAEPEVPQVVEVGTYLGMKTVLLRYDAENGAWLRVTPRSAVVAGERLLALPEFRPKITLASGLHLDMGGGTLVTMNTADAAAAADLPAAGSDVTAIDLVYGRIVLINTSNAERQVRLVLGPTTADARLAQNATLAVELERKYVPGNDPRKTPAPVIARMYVPDGGVTWQVGSEPTTIDKPSEWTIADGVATEIVTATAPPEWIDQEAVAQTSEQRYAAPVIEAEIGPDRPADVQLLELFQGRERREVKSLVARSGMHVGLFVPFIEALRDSAQRPNWNTHIQSLRSAMALSPESADAIWKTLVEQRGDRAATDMYEMLCGYNADQVGRTPEQLKSGAIERLIDWLDEDSLDYRVLAVHDLWEITGKQLMPNPAGNLTERARDIRRWRARLDAGDLEPLVSE